MAKASAKSKSSAGKGSKAEVSRRKKSAAKKLLDNLMGNQPLSNRKGK